MLRRPALAAALLLAAAAPTHGHAAVAPQIADAKGDALGAQAGTDIVSGLYQTTGTGTGKKYVPKRLVVTMTLAGPVVTTPGLTYQIQSKTSTCGVVLLTAELGTVYTAVTKLDGSVSWGTCVDPGGAALSLLKVGVKGSTLTWTFDFAQLPKALKVGTVFGDFAARVDPANPVLPYNPPGTAPGLIDAATGTATWRLG